MIQWNKVKVQNRRKYIIDIIPDERINVLVVYDISKKKKFLFSFKRTYLVLPTYLGTNLQSVIGLIGIEDMTPMISQAWQWWAVRVIRKQL